MILRAAVIAALLAQTGSAAVAQETPAQLLDKVKADIAADASRTWSLTRKSMVYEDDGSLKRTTVSRRDAGKWTLLSVNGAAPDAKIMAQFNEGAASGRIDAPRYHDLKDLISPSTRLVSETATQAIFRTSPLPKNAIMFDKTDLSPNLSGDLVVIKGAKPYVASVTIVNTKPFRISIATVSKFDMMLRYALGPQSVPVAIERKNTAIAKALFKTIVNKSHVELSDYR